MQLRLLKEGDWARHLHDGDRPALQTVLEEGDKDEWFAPLHPAAGHPRVVTLTLFAWIELTVGKPLISAATIKGTQFRFGTIALTMVGFALFGSVHILPAYLAEAGATMPSISGALGADRLAAVVA